MIRFLQLWWRKGRCRALAIRDQELGTLMERVPAPLLSRPYLLLRDLARFLSHPRLADRPLAARRLAICRRHPECHATRPVPRCLRCGCITAKIHLLPSHCPRGFW